MRLGRLQAVLFCVRILLRMMSSCCCAPCRWMASESDVLLRLLPVGPIGSFSCLSFPFGSISFLHRGSSLSGFDLLSALLLSVLLSRRERVAAESRSWRLTWEEPRSAGESGPLPKRGSARQEELSPHQRSGTPPSRQPSSVLVVLGGSLLPLQSVWEKAAGKVADWASRPGKHPPCPSPVSPSLPAESGVPVAVLAVPSFRHL